MVEPFAVWFEKIMGTLLRNVYRSQNIPISIGLNSDAKYQTSAGFHWSPNVLPVFCKDDNCLHWVFYHSKNGRRTRLARNIHWAIFVWNHFNLSILNRIFWVIWIIWTALFVWNHFNFVNLEQDFLSYLNYLNSTICLKPL